MESFLVFLDWIDSWDWDVVLCTISAISINYIGRVFVEDDFISSRLEETFHMHCLFDYSNNNYHFTIDSLCICEYRYIFQTHGSNFHNESSVR